MTDYSDPNRLNNITPGVTEQLDNNFRYHAPKPGQAELYADIRQHAKELATHLHAVCPPSRELSVAITNLETAVFWANAAIARS